MLATRNLFSPANGDPIVAPAQDIILGCYFLTMEKEGEPRHLPFAGAEDALHAYHQGLLDLHEWIDVRVRPGEKPQRITAGRLLFNEILPAQMRYVNQTMDGRALTTLIADVHTHQGDERTIQLLDEMKALGFQWASKAGITFSLTDMKSPESRAEILRTTEQAVAKANTDYRRGFMSPGERKQKVLELWTNASAKIADEIMNNIEPFNPISIITDSGARGSKKQITQLSGMRGLMSDPFGNIIEDLPVKSNFHEGLSVLEYFVTTHGARKGLADTALRTADAGYLTRRLVDVAQDVIIREIDCGTEAGIHVSEIKQSGNDVIETLSERIKGRTALGTITHPETGAVLVEKDAIIGDDVARAVEAAGVRRVGLRSVLACESRQGVCATCYGRDLATGKRVEIGVAVGIIAAQSIGEPGTQLTMRTFHTGGVASATQLTGVANVKRARSQNLQYIYDDAEQGRISLGTEAGHERERARAVQALLKVSEEQVGGLLRVVELFEARKPKGQAIISEFGGRIADIVVEGLKRVVLHTTLKVGEDAKNISGEIAAEDILNPENGEALVPADKEISDREARKIRDAGIETILVRKQTLVPYRGELEVKPGDQIEPGDRLTEGPLDPQKVLELQGIRGVQEYLVREVQHVYKQQGVDINDKHIEVIVRQMLRKRKVVEPGDAHFLHGQTVDRFQLEDENRRVEALEMVGRAATSIPVLLGITEASLATDSFLSAASFQKTTRVLTEAAVRGKRDALVGLKENVIIGRLIPAGTGLAQYRALEVMLPDGKALTLAPAARAGRGAPAALGAEEALDEALGLDSLAAAAAAQLAVEAAGDNEMAGDVLGDDE